MLITLVAILCNGALCLEKVVTNSEQSGITMSACGTNAQTGTPIGSRMALTASGRYRATSA